MSNSERILEFDVQKQRLTKRRSCDFSNLVAGTVGYLKAKFYFAQNEWRGCKKAASFWVNGEESAVLLDKSNTCLIPSEVLTGEKFYVSVTGMREDYRIVTNQTKVKQEVR